MIASIKREAMHRGITRLCHFTPSRNLIHIASGEQGILATEKLKATERGVFTPTDLERLDRHEGYISCSMEYPNAWYFDRARAKAALFKDWVIIFIDPKYLWLPGTRFCPRNAASQYGRDISEGAKAFFWCYLPTQLEEPMARLFVDLLRIYLVVPPMIRLRSLYRTELL